MTSKTDKKATQAIQEAGSYVDTFEKELTPAAERNAYHALVKAYNTGKPIVNLRKRFEEACKRVNHQ